MYICIKNTIDYKGKEIKKGFIINLNSLELKEKNFYKNRIKDGDFVEVKKKEVVKKAPSISTPVKNKKEKKGE